MPKNPLTKLTAQCNMAVVIATTNALVAEWYTQQVEGLCSQGRAGSSPVEGTLKRNVGIQIEQKVCKDWMLVFFLH